MPGVGTARSKAEKLRQREAGAPRETTGSSRRSNLLSLLRDKLSKYANNENQRRIVDQEIQNFQKKMRMKKVEVRHLNELESVIITKTSQVSSRVVSESKESNSESKIPELPTDSYQVFTEAQMFTHKKDVSSTKKERLIRQKETKAALDKQVAARHQYLNSLKKEDEEYSAFVEKNVQEWRISEKVKVDKISQRNLEVKRQRDIQRKQRVDRKQQEQIQREKEEAKMIQQAKQALQEQKDKIKRSMLEQKSYMVKVQKDNKELKRQKELEKIKGQEYDRLLQKQYIETQMKQEADRKANFDNMKAKSANNQMVYVKNMEEERRKDEETRQKNLAYQEARWKANEDKAIAVEKRRKNAKLQMNKTLAEQCNYREKVKEKQDAEDAIFAREYKAAAEKALADDKAAIERRRQKNYAHKRELQAQIAYNSRAKPETDSSVMSSNEQAINLQALRKIKEDKELVTHIHSRLQKSKKTERIPGVRRRCNLDGEPLDF